MDLKDRACFNCGEKGHTLSRCPKSKLKALVNDPAPPQTGSRAPTPKYTLCLDGDGFIPSHRLAQKPTPWSRATVRPSPKGLVMGVILGSAFAKLRQLEASESPDCTETDTPPVPTAKRTKNEKRQLRFCERACPGA